MYKKGILFEYDERKSGANRLKHGIDFEQAQTLRTDEHLLEVAIVFRDEARQLVTGQIGPLLWTAVFTLRHDRIRIFSVRRARDDEIKAYFSQRI